MADIDVLTQAGEELLADIIDGTIAAPTYYVGWGTGAVAAAKGNTALSSESADEDRVEATLSQPVGDTNRFVGKLVVLTNPKTITNSGVLTSATHGAGTLFIESSFDGLPLRVNDSIEFTWDVEWS